MKKTILIISILALLIAFAGCNGEESSGKDLENNISQIVNDTTSKDTIASEADDKSSDSKSSNDNDTDNTNNSISESTNSNNNENSNSISDDNLQKELLTIADEDIDMENLEELEVDFDLEEIESLLKVIDEFDSINN